MNHVCGSFRYYLSMFAGVAWLCLLIIVWMVNEKKTKGVIACGVLILMGTTSHIYNALSSTSHWYG